MLYHEKAEVNMLKSWRARRLGVALVLTHTG